MKQIGTWSKNKGSIMITIPKSRNVNGKLYRMRVKYIGYPDDPAAPVEVERDISANLGKIIILQPTSRSGGKIITP